MCELMNKMLVDRMEGREMVRGMGVWKEEDTGAEEWRLSGKA